MLMGNQPYLGFQWIGCNLHPGKSSPETNVFLNNDVETVARGFSMVLPVDVHIIQFRETSAKTGPNCRGPGGMVAQREALKTAWQGGQNSYLQSCWRNDANILAGCLLQDV